MAFRRGAAGLVLAFVAAAVVVLGTAGAAQAEIVNTPGYLHLKVGESGQCLMADTATPQVQQWRCLNTATEEWAKIPVAPVPGAGNTHFMLANRWTGLCVSLPDGGFPVNGTKVVQKPCDVSDVRQYWRSRYLFANEHSDEGPVYHIQSLQGALCLEKPDGNNTQGLQLQMWSCRSQNPNWNPFFDYHYEQWWQFF